MWHKQKKYQQCQYLVSTLILIARDTVAKEQLVPFYLFVCLFNLMQAHVADPSFICYNKHVWDKY